MFGCPELKLSRVNNIGVLCEVVARWCERVRKTVSIRVSGVSFFNSQGVQVTAFYDVRKKTAFIANRPAIFKSEIGWNKV